MLKLDFLKSETCFKSSVVAKTGLRLTIALLLLLIIPANAQVTFLGSMQSEDIAVCDDASAVPLEFVKFQMNQSTAGPVLVDVQLAEGIYYADGINIITPATGLEITLSNTDLNNPIFEITKSDGSGFNAEIIEFSFNRRANCIAYNNALTAATTGFEFKDEVTVSIDGNSVVEESNAYNVIYTNFVLNTPNAINNSNIGDNIERTFELSNGSLVPNKKAYVSVDYGDDAYYNAPGAATLEVDAGNGYVSLTPTTLVDGKATYELTGALLGANNQLDNGESITFRETFKLKTCDLNTIYTAGWGCDATDLCQAIIQESIITMASGVPSYSGLVSAVRSNYVSMCEPYTITLGYKNTGSGQSLGAMYDVNLLYGKYDNATTRIAKHSFSAVKIGGNAIPNATTGGRLDIRTNDFFTTDPDGVGVGLDDIDGDGFFDDLPAGETVEIEFTVTIVDDNMTCYEDVFTYYTFSKVIYRSACGDIENYNKSEPELISYSRRLIVDNSYLPANIESDVPFEARIGFGYYRFTNSYRSANTRFVYEIELPVGMTLSDIQYVSGTYPSDSAPQTPSSISQVGNALTIVSPGSSIGYLLFNGVYVCQNEEAVVTISYKVHEVADYINFPECISLGENLMCDSHTFRILGCEPCTTGGPSTGIPVIERLDNSLGWTDNTMTTLQDRANISAYDLAKSMYLDEFKVESNAIQNGPANNLGAKLKLTKDTQGVNGLEALSADIIITRNGNLIVSETGLTVFTNSNSTADSQIIDWDFTSILPESGLLDEDVIKIITNYRVVSENYPQVDENAGKDWFVYNSTSASGIPVWENDPIVCSALVPEFYLMGSSTINSTNAWNLSACSPSNLGSNLSFVARRFNSGAYYYADEFRPGLKISKVYLKVHKSLDINSVRWTVQNGGNTYLTANNSSQSGDFIYYEYTIPEELSALPLTVVNTYGGYLRLNVSANCSTTANPSIESSYDYTDYYYYAAKQPIVPSNLEVSNGLSRQRRVSYTNKPSIEVIDQTGIIQLAGNEGSWTVRYNNPSQSTAPYNWMAIANVPSLIINQVIRISDGAVITPTNYQGGKMYQLSETGVPSGSFEDYKIDFSYEGCNTLRLPVQGGWNCSEYPVTPNDYICSASSIELVAQPLLSLIEINQVQVPPTSPKPQLCTSLEYIYQMQSSDAANIYEPVFKITPATGLELDGDVEVEYPAGSGNWHTISPTPTLQGGLYTVDVMQHPALAALGYLPGIAEGGGDNANRQVNVKFRAITSCDFTSGKNFKVRSSALTACGNTVDGSNVPKTTPAINIQGAEAPYLLASAVILEEEASNGASCDFTRKISVQETINASNGTVTGNSGRLEFTLPEGYRYKSDSFIGTTNMPDINSLVLSQTATGTQQVATFDVPSGLGDGDVIEFSFNIEEDPTTEPVCGELTLEFNAIDVIAGLACGTTTCGNFSVVTGSQSTSFTIEKPSVRNLSITGIENNNIVGTYELATKALEDGETIILELACSGDPTNILSTLEIAGPLALGTDIPFSIPVVADIYSCTDNLIMVQARRTLADGQVQCLCSDANSNNFAALCNAEPTLSNTVDKITKVGISTLNREIQSNWVEDAQQGFLKLEAETLGFVPNRLTSDQRTDLTNPEEGMIIWNITTQCMEYYNGTVWVCGKNKCLN